MSRRESNVVLAVGMRIKMSDLGAERCPRLAAKTGIIIRAGGGRYSSLSVRFDGNKSITLLHPDYVKPLQ